MDQPQQLQCYSCANFKIFSIVPDKLERGNDVVLLNTSLLEKVRKIPRTIGEFRRYHGGSSLR